MADITRGRTFRTGEKLTPARLNSLIEQATVTNIASAELGSAFRSMFYSDTDPGATHGRIWFDTTAGAEGLKYAWLSPSNASIADWLYATPRREAYYYAATRVSLGSPLFIGNPQDLTDEMAIEKYDGAGLLKVYPAAGSTAATDISPALVVAMESVTEAGPIKCAWAGLVPLLTQDSQATLGNPFFTDVRDAARFKSSVDIPTTFSDDLVGYWHMDAATGATRPDVSGQGNHLADVGVTDVNQSTGLIDQAAEFAASTSMKLRRADSASLSLGDVDFTFSVWVWLDTKTAGQYIVSKSSQADPEREWTLFYAQSIDRFRFQMSDTGNAADQVSLDADTYGDVATGEWLHIVCQYDASADEMSIRVNNGVPDTLSHAGGAADASAPLVVGLTETNGSPLDGKVDELAIWKRKLSDTEISQLYNSGNGRLITTIKGNEELARGFTWGTILQDSSDTPVTNPRAVLWGTGPVIHDIEG